jgi:hypothetical protein
MEPLVYYAGIGSRKTPRAVIAAMRTIGAVMASNGFSLRSGGAEGADSAFEAGCDAVGGPKEIFLPRDGFEGRHASESDPSRNRFVFADPPTAAATAMAALHHPRWDILDHTSRLLHSRNCHQVLGRNLDSPDKLVICFTKGATGEGGTGQALRLSNAKGVKIVDLGAFRADELDSAWAAIEAVVGRIEGKAPLSFAAPLPAPPLFVPPALAPRTQLDLFS